jgi:hypothetical protein
LVSKLFDYYDDERPRMDLTPHFARVEALFQEVETILVAKLRMHLTWSEEDFGMLKSILDQVGCVCVTWAFFVCGAWYVAVVVVVVVERECV